MSNTENLWMMSKGMMQQLPNDFDIWKGNRPLVSIKNGTLEVYPDLPQDIEAEVERSVFP